MKDLTMRESLVISAGMMTGLYLMGPLGVLVGYVAGELANRVGRKVGERRVLWKGDQS